MYIFFLYYANRNDNGDNVDEDNDDHDNDDGDDSSNSCSHWNNNNNRPNDNAPNSISNIDDGSDNISLLILNTDVSGEPIARANTPHKGALTWCPLFSWVDWTNAGLQNDTARWPHWS